MILIIDNYDSFSYNLYQLIGEITPDIKVVRNNKVTVEEIIEMDPSAVILSPGPGRPADAGICEEAVVKLAGRFPILGVCLGHQAICEAFGGKITYANTLMHGKQSVATLNERSKIFEGLGEMIPVARYHSLAADRETLPSCLEVIATADDGEIMAVKHRDHEIYGLQVHPESIMTPVGQKILRNFIAITKA